MWVRPPGWVFHVALTVLLVLGIWCSGGDEWGALVLIAFLLGALGMAYLVRLVTYLAALARGHGRGESIQFGLAPLMVFLGLTIIVMTPILFALRWNVAQLDLDRVVASTEPLPSGERAVLRGPSTIGTLEFEAATQDGADVYFEFRSPDGRRRAYVCARGDSSATEHATHIEGCWFEVDR